jgi:hypothetical protein
MNPDQWAASEQEKQNLRESKAQLDQLLEAKEKERLRLMTEKGQAEQAINEVRSAGEKRYAELSAKSEQRDRAWLQREAKAVIDEVLTGRELAGVDPTETAKHLRTILESEIEAVMGQDGQPVIRHKSTFRPALDYLKERIESPSLGVFFAAKSRGGAGTDGTRTLAITPSNDPTGDYMKSIREMRERLVNAKTAPFQG